MVTLLLESEIHCNNRHNVVIISLTKIYPALKHCLNHVWLKKNSTKQWLKNLTCMLLSIVGREDLILLPELEVSKKVWSVMCSGLCLLCDVMTVLSSPLTTRFPKKMSHVMCDVGCMPIVQWDGWQWMLVTYELQGLVVKQSALKNIWYRGQIWGPPLWQGKSQAVKIPKKKVV